MACKRKTKKEKVYVCRICGKKSKNKTRCCGKQMVSENKGSWNI